MREKDFSFTLEETAGAIGDYGTILPIVFGVALATDMDLSLMLLFFGLAFIGTGLFYRMPMPVEPMKAMGIIAMADGLAPGVIAGAGLTMSLLLLVIGLTNTITIIKRIVPASLTRGIQLGLGLLLIRQALIMISSDPLLGIGAIAVIFLFQLKQWRDISALIVILGGLVAGCLQYGLPPVTFITLPVPEIPDLGSIASGFWTAAVPQIPLTLGNAVLATSLLVTDLLDRKVEEKQLLFSMSIMCGVSSLFGGFPMCHGAGGLAAQYRFGARTGGSNLISGVVFLGVAVFFATPLLERVIPFGPLGALLLFSGFTMLKTAWKSDDRVITFIMGTGAFVFGIAPAFVVMIPVSWGKTAILHLLSKN